MNGWGGELPLPTPPAPGFKAFMVAVRNICSSYVCSREIMRIILFANGSVWSPPNPTPPLLSNACLQSRISFHYHACSEGGLCRSFCLQLGGGTPQPPPPLNPPPRLLLSVSCQPLRTSCQHYVCSKGELCGSFCWQTERGSLCHAIRICCREHHVITRFAEEESYANHLASKSDGVGPQPPESPQPRGFFWHSMLAAKNMMS